MIRVLIVENEGLFQEMLRGALSGQPQLEVVGVVGDGESAVVAARECRPGVVVTDIELGSGLNGIEAAQLIRKENGDTGIVILSVHKEAEYLASIPADQAHGWSYLLKQSVGDVQALVRAIEGSAAGFVVLDPAVVAGIRPRADSPLARLTRRQLEVLSLMALGHSNGAIAEKLFLCTRSVENYINAIYQSMHLTEEGRVQRRVHAVLTYLDHAA